MVHVKNYETMSKLVNVMPRDFRLFSRHGVITIIISSIVDEDGDVDDVDAEEEIVALTYDHEWDVARKPGCWVGIGSWRRRDALLTGRKSRRCSKHQRQHVAARSFQTSSPTPTQLVSTQQISRTCSVLGN